jgi:hypothetical protein
MCGVNYQYVSKKRCGTVDLRTILVADYANIAQGGKPNVMGIFGVINAEKCPVRQPEMYFIARLTAGAAEFGRQVTITVKLMDSDAKLTLVDLPQQTIVPTAKGGRRAEVNVIVRLRDIVFPDFGAYQFSILVDNDEKGTLPIEVNKIEHQQS